MEKKQTEEVQWTMEWAGHSGQIFKDHGIHARTIDEAIEEGRRILMKIDAKNYTILGIERSH